MAGVDGCRAGWLVVRTEPDPFRVVSVEVTGDIGVVIDDAALEHVAIDMPIGLADDGPRACDIEARRACGPRRSSVFPAPVRAVLEARDYADALARSRAACGVGLSKQSWNLVPRIAQLDAAMRPDLQTRVRETHPEMAFAVLAGAPMDDSKHTAAGRAARLDALGVAPPSTPRGAAPDDVLDAIALARSAARFACGDGVCVGDGRRDARGLLMQIWW